MESPTVPAPEKLIEDKSVIPPADDSKAHAVVESIFSLLHSNSLFTYIWYKNWDFDENPILLLHFNCQND